MLVDPRNYELYTQFILKSLVIQGSHGNLSILLCYKNFKIERFGPSVLVLGAFWGVYFPRTYPAMTGNSIRSGCSLCSYGVMIVSMLAYSMSTFWQRASLAAMFPMPSYFISSLTWLCRYIVYDGCHNLYTSYGNVVPFPFIWTKENTPSIVKENKNR